MILLNKKKTRYCPLNRTSPIAMTVLSDTHEKPMLIQFREGESLSFDMVFERFYLRLCVFANRFVNDAEASKDIVNEVFVKFWKSPERLYDHMDHLLASLYLSTKNNALNYRLSTVRAMKRNFTFYEEQEDEDPFYLAEVTRAEMLAELHVAIATLPEKAGRIIRETYLEGKSNQEVADEMGISIQTLRNQKSRALALLRGRVSKQSFEFLIVVGCVLHYSFL